MMQGPRLECEFYASESSFLHFSLTAYFEPGRKEVEPNLKFEIQNCGQIPVFWYVAKAQILTILTFFEGGIPCIED
ncbi:MAG: hypothetical protein ACETVZ_08940 [Phycisphaerae bacterium]